MKLEIGKVLTLNDKKYAISQETTYEGVQYLLLIEVPSYKSFKYVKVVDNDYVEDLEDTELIEKISNIFVKNGNIA